MHHPYRLDLADQLESLDRDRGSSLWVAVQVNKGLVVVQVGDDSAVVLRDDAESALRSSVEEGRGSETVSERTAGESVCDVKWSAIESGSDRCVATALVVGEDDSGGAAGRWSTSWQSEGAGSSEEGRDGGDGELHFDSSC